MKMMEEKQSCNIFTKISICAPMPKLVLLEKQNLPLLDKGICAPMPFFIVHKIRNPKSIVRKLTKMLKTFERLLRTSKRQEAEIKLGSHLLNQMTRLGMSDSIRIR